MYESLDTSDQPGWGPAVSHGELGSVSFPRADDRGQRSTSQAPSCPTHHWKLGKEVFRVLFVGDLGGDALTGVGIQRPFGAAYPLPCLVQINATIEHPLDI